jgi:hypothetical protein
MNHEASFLLHASNPTNCLDHRSSVFAILDANEEFVISDNMFRQPSIDKIVRGVKIFAKI